MASTQIKRTSDGERAMREDDDDCAKRAGLMSMLGSLRSEASAIEDRVSELSRLLSPLCDGEIEPPWACDSDEKKESRFGAPALAEIDQLRERLQQVGGFINVLLGRVSV